MDILSIVWKIVKFILVTDVIFVILMIRLAKNKGRW